MNNLTLRQLRYFTMLAEERAAWLRRLGEIKRSAASL